MSDELSEMPKESMDQLIEIAREHHPDVVGIVVLHGSADLGLQMSAWSSWEGDDPHGWLYSMVRHAYEDPEIGDDTSTSTGGDSS